MAPGQPGSLEPYKTPSTIVMEGEQAKAIRAYHFGCSANLDEPPDEG